MPVLKVMLVDDEPWVLEGLRTMVNWEKFGFAVCGEALNGPEALRRIPELKPDLVLTDIHMPVIDGLELIEKVNEAMEHPPRFVILSGYDDFRYARAALRQRVDQYLLKPVDDEEMETLLTRLGSSIRNEIASRGEKKRKQSLLIHHLLTQYIRGEDAEPLRLMAGGLLPLAPDAELVCLLITPSCAASELAHPGEGFSPCELAFEDGFGRTGCLIETAGLSDAELSAALRKLHEELSGRMHEPVIFAVSERHSGLRSLRTLYDEALETWRMNMYKERGGIYYYGILCRQRKQSGIVEASFAGLLKAIQSGMVEAIRAQVRELLLSFAGRRLPALGVQAQIAHLEMTLCMLMLEQNGDPGAILGSVAAACGSLEKQSDYAGLGRYTELLALQAAAGLAELQKKNEGNTIYNVIQYVDQEFRGRLQLQDLAKIFHMNSAYLGQLFRKETGRSFSDYLNEKRIEAAKGLLKRTQLKISDIAQQVGFANTDYFIDKFKQTVGVVPSVYKKNDLHPPQGKAGAPADEA